jgi:tetratricopeptide (TPR) repeat protein
MVPRGDNHAAVALFQRAIQLDPNFAMAYASLGTSYFNLGEDRLGAYNTKKAYELRERLSQRERFYIEAHYCDQVTGDLEKARQVYELWAQTYPNDFVPHDNLGGIYTQLGHYERALDEDIRAFRLDPVNASNYADRVADYIYLNRLGEAEITAEQALSKNLGSPKLHTRLYLLAFLRSDRAEMAHQVFWGAGEPGVEDILLALEAETAAYGGRLTKARELSRRAVLTAQNAGERETAASYEVCAALREALMGNRLAARRRVAAALRLSTGRDVEAGAALALAFIGETARSQTLVDDLARKFPDDTIVQFNYLPTIRAQVALDGRDSRKAIAAADVAVLYELGYSVDRTITPAMYPIYVRGQAYLGAGDGHKSATEFKKVLDHPGVVQNEPVGALAHLGLARAYVLQGDTVKARTEYQDLLGLWKDADYNLPILKQAKAEYAKLQ